MTNVLSISLGMIGNDLTSDYDQALLRIQTGYALPPLPASKSEWKDDYIVFMDEFVAVMKQRQADYNTIQAPDEMLTRCSDAVIALCIARVARDLDVIACFHQLIMDSRKPQSIRGCVQRLRKVYPGAKASTMITHAHVEAASSIREAVWYLEHPLNVDPVEMDEVIDDLTIVGFENMAHVDTITDLIRNGMIQPDRLRIALASFDGTSSALLGGTL